MAHTLRSAGRGIEATDSGAIILDDRCKSKESISHGLENATGNCFVLYANACMADQSCPIPLKFFRFDLLISVSHRISIEMLVEKWINFNEFQLLPQIECQHH